MNVSFKETIDFQEFWDVCMFLYMYKMASHKKKTWYYAV